MKPLVALLLAAGCGAGSGPVARSAAVPAPPAPAIVSNAAVYRFAGRLWNRAVALLPAATRRPVSGAPGHGYLLGTIQDPDRWHAFAAAAELRDLPALDFGRHMVVFAVLDAHTSALSPATWKLDSAGRAVFTFAEAGSEPDDPDSSPGTLAVIDRAGVKSIAFRTLDGQDLGTVAL